MSISVNKSSIAWSDDELPVVLGTSLMKKTEFTPAELSRHTLLIGETGTGKTQSGVMPFTKAMFEYRTKENLKFSALVIDPKMELHDFLSDLDSQQGLNRVISIDDESVSFNINPFEGVLSANTLADKLSFFFNIYNAEKADDSNSIFRNCGLSLLKDCANLEEAFYAKTKRSLFEMLAKLCVPHIKEATFLDGLFVFTEMGMECQQFFVPRF